MMQSFLILAVAVIPAILTTFWFRSRDHERMAAGLAWEAFFVGACSALLVVAAVTLAGLDAFRGAPVTGAWIRAFAGAAIPEELAKLAVIFVIARRSIDRCFPHDFIVIGAAVAGGFAALENIAYIMKAENQFGTAFIRALLSVPSHIFHGVMIGGGLALYEMRRRIIWPVMGVVLAIVFHGLFNFPIMLMDQATALQGTPWHLIVGGRITTAIALIGAFMAAALSVHVMRRESRTASRLEPPDASPWRRRMVLIEMVGWLVLGILLLAGAALVLVAVIWRSPPGAMPLAGIFLLYACGALYQGWAMRRITRLRRNQSLSTE
ncbi:PrsW family glutamic-type intramembrane protease [Ferrovibrio sp.]|uniref:PrsW family intramembrane metalloprotease n=1 Tax=Ferrovibrio sp. TaxID=1917215 RepID=UPI000CCAE08B|nr:PrsW family glutamic-type intramembrane protease [Ferrovibrio sp.]PJI43431.1 MAG: hypothetical protein CTR53_03965 [Ferrovibrio sp.]